jgi:hypothetical protein
LGTLFDNHVDLRKLILKVCSLGNNVTGILTKIVALYPDLEALSLEGCSPIRSADYCLIARLKKLSELNLPYCQVHYVYVKLLQILFCVREFM